ncbi:MAG: DUF937 domain-containing protein [Saprospiraceae bacterium]|nr:DUF937 domain-containing protein [Saprospiraceae bacterium]
MNILEMLQGQMNPQVLQQIAQQVGVNDPKQVEVASNGLMSTLVAALSKNATSQSGLNALVSALDRDHDGSILNDLSGFITGAMQPSNTSASNGGGILGHVLGNLQPNVIDMVGRISGLDKNQSRSDGYHAGSNFTWIPWQTKTARWCQCRRHRRFVKKICSDYQSTSDESDQ